eukprot:snap_masked-scaffold_81-processed-gene-0.22-mRNA-1 protein AED:1.00 eAED:1.00 QI:0/0/0/0/1/1/3/0/76
MNNKIYLTPKSLQTIPKGEICIILIFRKRHDHWQEKSSFENFYYVFSICYWFQSTDNSEVSRARLSIFLAGNVQLH